MEVNQTSSERTSEVVSLEFLLNLTEQVYMYYLPGVLAFGLTSNILLVAALLTSTLKKRYYSHVFAAIAICDLGFLLTILLSWIRGHDVEVYKVPGLCQILVCAMHFFPFLSFWLTISGSFSILFRNPFRFITHICAGPGKARTLIISWAIFTFTIYIYKTWTNGVLIAGGRRYCTVLPQVKSAMRILSILDIVFLLVIPYVVITVFDLIVLCLVARKCIYRTLEINPTLFCDSFKVLVCHSILFHIFVGPSCISKLIIIRKSVNNEEVGMTYVYTDSILQFVFYTYFALKPLFHIIVSQNLRVCLADTVFKARRSVLIPRVGRLPSSQEQTLL